MNIPNWPKILFNTNKPEDSLIHARKILQALGNPHEKLPPIIHIAGTNGKGSTQAMLKTIFEQAKYKVLTYTSPHLCRFNERIYLAGNDISDSHLKEVIEKTKYKADTLGINPSFFTGTTIAAFLAFADIDADILILETGLGGRLDCTNIIKSPILTIITPIGYDHMEYLGNKLSQIAYEKAGIIKHKTPCIISAQTDEIYKLLIKQCFKLSSPSYCYSYDFNAKLENDSFIYQSRKYEIEFPLPSLPGDHQIINASSVIASILTLNNKFNISLENIKNGLINTKWPGRIEKVDKSKYSNIASDNISIFLDGAHNNLGAHILSKWAKNYINEPLYLIIGMTQNRNPQEFSYYFKNIVQKIYTVTIKSEPSSYSSDTLKKLIKYDNLEVISNYSLEESIKAIANEHKNNNATIIITGSLFLIADFYKIKNVQ